MNNQVRELAEQAGIWRQHYDVGLESPQGLEKFAELLIQECVKILINGEGNENTTDAIWDLEKLGVDVGQILDRIVGDNDDSL